MPGQFTKTVGKVMQSGFSLSFPRCFQAVILVGLSSTLAAQSSAPAPQPAKGKAPRVIINRVTLTENQVKELETRFHIRIPDGSYWYDKASGVWGLEGGPGAGIGVPGLDVGGPLRADASRGNTKVFINGRELHALDVMVLQRLGPVLPGRYWVDAYGNCGFEGGPAFVNLYALARAKQAQGGGSWSVSNSSSWVGGDGSGFLGAQFKDSSGRSVSWTN